LKPVQSENTPSPQAIISFFEQPLSKTDFEPKDFFEMPCRLFPGRMRLEAHQSSHLHSVSQGGNPYEKIDSVIHKAQVG